MSTVHDAYKDPYERIKRAGIARVEFNKQKRTHEFIKWRKWQLKVQGGLCAYCKIPLKLDHIITHVDHVTPLYHGGKNSYNNYVLSCRKCNVKKWTKNSYVVPEWITKSSYQMSQTKKLQMIRKKQKQQAIEILDDILWESMREWI